MTRTAPLVFAVLLVPSLACATTGSGVKGSESRSASTFKAINVGGSVDAKVSVGSPASVRVECDDNLVKLIRTQVEGDTLVIETASGHDINPKGPCFVAVTMPELTALDVTGSSDVQVRGAAQGLSRVVISGSGDVDIEAAKADAVKLQISGSGDIKVQKLEAKDVSFRISGSGDIMAAGTATSVRIDTSGSGDVNAKSLTAESGEVHTSGSSDVKMYASKRAVISVSGAGDVVVAGQPKEREVDVSGVASIRWE